MCAALPVPAPVLAALSPLLAHSSLRWLRLALLILPQTLAQEQNDNWLPLAAMNKIAEVRGAAWRGAGRVGVRPMALWAGRSVAMQTRQSSLKDAPRCSLG